MKYKDMNEHQKIAYRNIKAAFNYEVGGWYNCLQDNCPEYIPDTLQEAKDFIYEECLNNAYGAGYCGSGKAPKEMRFAGTEFIKERINKLFEKDDDVKAIAEVKGWTL